MRAGLELYLAACCIDRPRQSGTRMRVRIKSPYRSHSARQKRPHSAEAAPGLGRTPSSESISAGPASESATHSCTVTQIATRTTRIPSASTCPGLRRAQRRKDASNRAAWLAGAGHVRPLPPFASVVGGLDSGHAEGQLQGCLSRLSGPLEVRPRAPGCCGWLQSTGRWSRLFDLLVAVGHITSLQSLTPAVDTRTLKVENGTRRTAAACEHRLRAPWSRPAPQGRLRRS
jgi:hypothetical protein